MLLQWNTDYLVIAYGPCHVKCIEGQGMDYVADSADADGKRCAIVCYYYSSSLYLFILYTFSSSSFFHMPHTQRPRPP